MFDQSHELPAYFSDLNAVHDAEKVLTDEQHYHFRMNLVKVINPQASSFTWTELDERHLISSTAPQRAEAFLKTLNLWRD